jgi:hypothetical protein
MTEQTKDVIAADVAELMTRYSFDSSGYRLEQWIEQWLRQYPAEWLSRAVIEALYQGRYKAVSVGQILELWRRRGRPLQHFNREFERMISGRSLQLLFAESRLTEPIITVPQPVLIAAEANGRTLHRNSSVAESRPSASQSSSANSSLVLPPRLSPCDAPPLGPPPSIQPFKPSEQFKLTLPGEIRCSHSTANASLHSIQQFVPAPEPSGFHDKLKAIAQALVIANAQTSSATLEAASREAVPLAEASPLVLDSSEEHCSVDDQVDS